MVPFRALQTAGRTRPLVLVYHMVSDEPVPHTGDLYAHKTTAEFDADLEFLRRQYRPIGLTDLLAEIESGGTGSEHTVLITFDDGFREASEIVAPLLSRKGIPAAFFITKDWVGNRSLFCRHKASLLADRYRRQADAGTRRACRDLLSSRGLPAQPFERRILAAAHRRPEVLERAAALLGVDFGAYLRRVRPYLDADQIRDLMRQGFAIGAHSVDHPRYEALSLEEQVRQTLESVAFVTATFHTGYRAYAFPFDDRAVSRAYFDRVNGQDLVDISFGTGGMRDETVPRHFQRVGMEPMDARTTLSRSYIGKLARRCAGRNRTVRV